MERKVAIITGSRRGIGEAIAYKLAQNGYSIVINMIEKIKSKLIMWLGSYKKSIM